MLTFVHVCVPHLAFANLPNGPLNQIDQPAEFQLAEGVNPTGESRLLQ